MPGERLQKVPFRARLVSVGPCARAFSNGTFGYLILMQCSWLVSIIIALLALGDGKAFLSKTRCRRWSDLRKHIKVHEVGGSRFYCSYW